MKIAIINVPLRVHNDASTWITVPPAGYGGIQWVVANLIDGLTSSGHSVFLLGAPGSESSNPGLTVVNAGAPHEIKKWLNENRVDIIHDHSNGVVPLPLLGTPFVSTHHLTGAPKTRKNAVYLSNAQREAFGGRDAPVIRLPVNAARYIYQEQKENYLLALGRVSRWKGVFQAAQFAEAAGVPLRIAGPSWEPEYLELILSTFGTNVEYVGETGGEERLRLLANARALLAFSQRTMGPWGDLWCEPGATVVSEAAVSGTPVISTDNGCLAEITPHVGIVVPEADAAMSTSRAKDILEILPVSAAVRAAAMREWGHIKTARSYLKIYNEVIGGREWN